ncbi:MAG TPA: hypothetical protein PKL03_05735 [Candidatus Omnitrophota bacterium]|nr:hypothetical protein [Candidatus Omnitrophota bacterium]
MKYSSDPKTNRLRITRAGKTVYVNGAFRVSAGNGLEYWLNSPPAWRWVHNLPSKIAFTGSWKLTGQDDLQLSVSKASYMPEALSGVSRITLIGRIISAQENALIFESRSLDTRGNIHSRLLRLTGAWGSDDANRIIFSVAKKDRPDVLTLSGTWSVNDNQQITYTAEKYDLARRDKTISIVEFTGSWQVSASNRISYVLRKGSASRFDLRAHLETPNIYPQAGVIKYRLGTGVRQSRKGHPTIICLYGQWKIGRKLAPSFEMEYEKGRVCSLEFGCRFDVSKKDRIEAALTCARGEDLGGRLIFTRRFLAKLDADLFVRLKKTARERSVDAGVTIPF